MNYLLQTLIILILWPSFLWLIGCSFISFVGWNNYFIVGIYEWDNLARFIFIVTSAIGAGVCIVGLRTNSITKIDYELDNLDYELDNLDLPFKYDEIFYNSLTGSYDFMMNGELMGELKLPTLTANSVKRQL
jgi:hypothetical protein